MTDDLNNASHRGAPHRARINIHEPQEVTYWAQALGCSSADLEAAVMAVGPSVDAVRCYLGEYRRPALSRN